MVKASQKPDEEDKISQKSKNSKAKRHVIAIPDEWKTSFENLLADPKGLEAFTVCIYNALKHYYTQIAFTSA